MIAKNKKLKFLTFILSIIMIFSFVGASSFVFAEPSAEAYETDIATEAQEIEENTHSEITEPTISTEISGMGTVGIISTESTSTTDTETDTDTTTYEAVDIPDGVYALRSEANDERWIDIQHNSTSPGAHVQQHYFAGVSPAETYKPSGLFHFTRVGDTNRFIIRLELNTNLTFTYDSNGNVITKTIPANDAAVDINDTFIVIKRSHGIQLKKYGTSEYISSQDAEASGAADAPSSYLVAATGAGSNSIWFLDGYNTYIEDGVYCFKSPYNSLWIDTRGNSSSPGAIMQQCHCADIPAQAFTRSALFKISRVSGTDRYIIRSMLNNTLSFGISNDKIVTKTIAAVDSQVATSDTFRIRCYGNAFLIQPYGSAYVISSGGLSASGAADAPDSDLCLALKPTSTTLPQMWDMYKYTGETRQGCVITRPSAWKSEGFVVNTSGNMSLKTWSTVINANKPDIGILPEYSDLATYTYNPSTYTMTLTATNPGRLRIETRILLGDTSTYAYEGGYARFYIVPEEGTYYIQNVGSGRYVDVEGPSLNDGAAIHEWDFRTNPQEKWIVEHVANSDGYIRLKSVYSNKYIGIDPDALSYVKQYAAQNNYTLWRIERTSSGNLTFQCKVYQGTDAVMAVPTASTVNGTNLIMAAYTDNTTYRDEWNLYHIGPYAINLEIVYDNAYVNRYSDAYNRTTENVLILQEKYLTEFGITVNLLSASLFSSYADLNCSTSHTHLCSHATDEQCYNSVLYASGNVGLQSLHHNNIYNIMLRIPFPNTETSVKVAYIGHDFCSANREEEDTDKDGVKNLIEHKENHVYGLTYKSIGLATITNFGTQSNETKTFIHEFGHFYGIIDHYGGDGKGSDEMANETGRNYSEFCIYGEKRNDASVLADYTICDGCKYFLEANGNWYDH